MRNRKYLKKSLNQFNQIGDRLATHGETVEMETPELTDIRKPM